MTIEMRRGRPASFLVLTFLLLGAALWALPSAIDAGKLLALRENPVSVADAFAKLGRGALVFAGLATAAVEAVFTVLAAFVGLEMVAQRFGFWVV